MPSIKGIDTEIVGPVDYAESGGLHVIDLYVSYEGLEALRDNTSRPYSQYFDDLLKQVDGRLAEYDGIKQDQPEQDPLPGL